MNYLVKRGLLVFVTILFLNLASSADCADNQLILRLSSEVNAHASLWNLNTGADTDNNYGVKVCYNDIFGTSYSGSNPHSTAYPVLWLSSNSNAHASGSSSSGYSTIVGFDGLVCRSVSKEVGCNVASGEKEVVRMSGETNAHLAIRGTDRYSQLICCKVLDSIVGESYWANGLGTKISGTCVGKTVFANVRTVASAGTEVEINVYKKRTSSDLLVNSTKVSAQGNNLVSLPWRATEAGEFYFKAKISGAEGTSEGLTVRATGCEDNVPPVAVISKPIHRQIYYANNIIEFNQTSYDSDGRIVSYLWTIEENGNIITDGNSSFNKIFTTAGQKTITLRVTDNDGASAESQIAILVSEGDKILAFINSPRHMQEIVDNNLYIRGETVVNFSSSDSYVVKSVISSSSPCSVTVQCLAGNCPIETQQSPVCSGNIENKIPVSDRPKDFTKMSFEWNFTDLGIVNVSQNNPTIGAEYLIGASNAREMKSVRLVIGYSEDIVAGQEIFQETSRKFFIARQCVKEGGIRFYNLTSYGTLDTSKVLNPLTDASVCKGPDGLNGTNDDCCPSGFYCPTSGVCLQNPEPVLELCERYKTESSCSDDSQQVISGGNGPYNYPGLWEDKKCDSRITEGGDSFDIDCLCAWNTTASEGYKCQFTAEKNKVIWGTGGGGSTRPNPIYQETWNYNIGECVSGVQTWTGRCTCLGGTCSALCVSGTSGTQMCGEANVELPFFGFSQFLLALGLSGIVYLFIIRRNK